MKNHISVLSFQYLLLYIVLTSGSNDDIGSFWQLTDVHLDLDYAKHSCNGTYGDLGCDSPLNLVQSAVNAMKTFSGTTPPDFIIWSGDNGPHMKNLPGQRLQDHIEAVSRILRTVFPRNNTYILPTIGNHDVNPANEMSPQVNDAQRLSWCHKLATNVELWATWIDPAAPGKDRPVNTPDDLPWANFSTGCFHSHLLPDRNLLLVGLNGLIWYTGNSLAGNAGPDPLGQLAWLNRTFSWARETKHKVLLVCHFPPGASENAPRQFEFLRPEINDGFVRLLQQNADVLMAGLFAHEHVDSFRVLRDPTARPAVSLFLAPSVCPLRLRGLGSFNPRIRRYRYQRSSGLLLGFTQYFLNLSHTESPRWVLEYDTGTTYALRDLSPASMAGLLDRLERDESPDGPWARYWEHELGGRPHEPRSDVTSPDGRCPHSISVCRCEHVCAMRNLVLSTLHDCLASCSMKPRAASGRLSANLSDINGTSGGSGVKQGSSLPIIVGVIIAFLVILVGVVLLVNREICRKRGRYSSRFVGPGNSVGGVIFSTLNGSVPRPFGGTGLTVGASNGCGNAGMQTQCDSIAGSSTELRVAFQPHYAMEDEFSVTTQGTVDQNADYRYPAREHYSRGESSARRSDQLLPMSLSHPNKSIRTNGVTAVAVSPAPISSDNRYSVPEFHRDIDRFGTVAGRDRSLGSAAQLGDQGSVHPGDGSVTALPSAVSNLSCPAEDYYADDEEAFGDDEDEGEESEQLGEPSFVHDHHPPSVVPNNVDDDGRTSSSDSGPFDDGGQPFNLNPDKTAKPVKSIKDWNFITKRRSKRGCGPLHRRQSIEDPLSVNHTRRSDYVPVAHSQSITMGLGVTEPVYAHVDPIISRTGLLRGTDLADPARPISLTNGNLTEQPVSRTNGLSTRELGPNGTVHQPLGYDYVRM